MGSDSILPTTHRVGPFAEVLIKDATGHLQMFFDHALAGQSSFGRMRRAGCIRQLVIMADQCIYRVKYFSVNIENKHEKSPKVEHLLVPKLLIDKGK